MDDRVEAIRECSHAPGCWQEGKESRRLVKSSISSAVCKEMSFYALNSRSRLLWKPSCMRTRRRVEPGADCTNAASRPPASAERWLRLSRKSPCRERFSEGFFLLSLLILFLKLERVAQGPSLK